MSKADKKKSTYEFAFIIDKAMTKYPRAKRICVENFTDYYSEMTLEASGNLGMEVDLCHWNSHTVAAIKYVLDLKRVYLSSK